MEGTDIEKSCGEKVGIVANYGKVTAANKQWLAAVSSYRAAFYGIQQDQNSWDLATSQSKLNVCDDVWTEFIRDLRGNKARIKKDLGL